MTLAECQARVGAREFAEWEAFYRLEPWGDYRADYRMGILAAVTVNQWRGKRDAPAMPDDFLPRFGTDASAQAATTAAPNDEDEAFATALVTMTRRT